MIHSPRLFQFAVFAVLQDQADSFALPFARRRAKTLRPLEVAILLRKPCTFDL